MEIEGVWIPREILDHIASFLVFDHDWDTFCDIFGTCASNRALSLIPTFTRVRDGLVLGVDHIYWKARYTRGWCSFALHKHEITYATFYAQLIDHAAYFVIRGSQEHALQFRRGYDDVTPEMLTRETKISLSCEGGWSAVRIELLSIYRVLMAEVNWLYDWVNAKNVLSEKRPRKRVKRFGFYFLFLWTARVARCPKKHGNSRGVCAAGCAQVHHGVHLL
jgi:hypothetical protein